MLINEAETVMEIVDHKWLQIMTGLLN